AAAEIFHHDLIQKIRHLGAKARRTSVGSSPLAPVFDRVREPLAKPAPSLAAQTPLMRRPFSMLAPRVLLIGSSTGGPQALMNLVTEIGPVLARFSVLLPQHVPPTFTTSLDGHLVRSSRRPADEAVAREVSQAGRVYLAPGGRP